MTQPLQLCETCQYGLLNCELLFRVIRSDRAPDLITPVHRMPCSCTACRVRAQHAVLVHSMPCSCTACRVRAQHAALVHSMPCACTACRARAQHAVRVHSMPCSCTASLARAIQHN